MQSGALSHLTYMLTNTILLVAFFVFFYACEGTKNSSGNNLPESTNKNLSGKWLLFALPDQKLNFDSLYPSVKPFIEIDVFNKRFSGNSSCNHYGGELNLKDSKIDFTGPIITTEMYCGGEGEPVFIKTLIGINNFTVVDSFLLFKSQDSVKMKFKRQ